MMTTIYEDPRVKYKDFRPQTRHILAAFYIAILIICWIGNAFVLHGTIRHRALNLGQFSVWIIQTLCVADMLHGLFHLLPATIALSTGYDLGDACTPLFVIKYTFIDMNSFLVNALVFNKIYRCSFPLRPQPTFKVRMLIPALATLCGSIYSVVSLIRARRTDGTSFKDNFVGCEPDMEETPENYKILDLSLTCVVIVMPITTLLIGNATLLIMAWHIGSKPPNTAITSGGQGSQINKKNFLIIGMTTFVYTLSQLPYLYFIFQSYGIINTINDLQDIKFMRFSFIVMQTSCFINPIIYFLTNKGFREYTKQCCRCSKTETSFSSAKSIQEAYQIRKSELSFKNTNFLEQQTTSLSN